MLRIAVATTSAFVSWVAYYKIAQFVDSSAPAFLASIILLSIVAHELGHWAAMEFYGIRAGVIFLVILGGAFPTDTIGDENPLDKLDGSKYSVTILAGVAMNFVLIALSWICLLFGWLPRELAMPVINLNALLIVWNLLPFGLLDGGRFAKRFFDGVPENRDMIYVVRIGAVVVGGALVVGFLTGKIPFLMVFLLIWGMHKKATTDDPVGSTHPLAMNSRQENFWAIVYGVMLVASLLISYTTPNWGL